MREIRHFPIISNCWKFVRSSSRTRVFFPFKKREFVSHSVFHALYLPFDVNNLGMGPRGRVDPTPGPQNMERLFFPLLSLPYAPTHLPRHFCTAPRPFSSLNYISTSIHACRHPLKVSLSHCMCPLGTTPVPVSAPWSSSELNWWNVWEGALPFFLPPWQAHPIEHPTEVFTRVSPVSLLSYAL